MADESEWVVESIAGYLGSAEWVVPVTDFMEHKCTVFDDEDENKLSYTEIHEQYKQLVEELLGSYLQEVGLSELQFVQACASPLAQSKALQAVFQPVLATDDFQLFKSLMVQKNLELQLQALRVLQERNGALPECLMDGEDVMSEMEQQELRILKEVLRRSKEEYEQEMAHRKVSEEASSSSTSSSDRTALDTPPATATPPGPGTERESQGSGGLESREEVGGVSGAHVQKSSPAAANQLSREGSGEARVLGPLRVPVKGVESKMSGSQAAECWLEEARKEAGISKSFTELSAAQQGELQQRALYLRQQRDKLQALRKEQRPQPPQQLPASSALTPTPQEISADEKKSLEKRKRLAEKLKEEVIKK
ncbi:cilia- and flagella-associated protein 36-like [Conger conger]|uniref:cilia- and flagella-associated protein 36-like n=1 Tax=Conger conger TaxID=82655 RepID=UPI002A5ABA76|nr:cilia- and flagella-associated protein 36-like [Conger conger]